MASYTATLPEWNKVGSEPNATKRNDGWGVGEHPPADWFNWQWNLTYLALKELQENAVSKSNPEPFTSPIKSTVPTGTAPLIVASQTLVSNLNADMLDGLHADAAASGSTIAARNATGFINARGFISNATTGTAPLTVASTTMVANLNADMVDGEHVNEGAVARTIAGRDGNGDLTSRRFVSSIATGTSPLAVTSTTVNTNLNADMVDGFHMNQDVRTTASPTFVKATFSQAAGVAPFTVTSPTAVINLNADMVDGLHADISGSPDTLAARDSSGNVTGNILVSSQASGTPPLTVTSTTKVTNLNADSADGFHFDQDVRKTASPTFVKVTSGSISSTATTGTAPLTVSSTTLVTNLNADMVDGFHMDQNLIKTASPTFAGLDITGPAWIPNLSGDVNVEGVLRGAGEVSADTLTSRTTTEAPISVKSSALVVNLNADKLDGKHASEFETHTTSIPAAQDLNLFYEEGFYYCENDTLAQALVNCPVRKRFTMRVQRFGTSSRDVTQILTTAVSSDNIQYIRTCIGGVWGGWVRSASKEDTTFFGSLSTEGTDNFLINFTPPLTAYFNFMRLVVRSGTFGSKVTPTLNVNGLGAKPIVNADGSVATILPNTIYTLVYYASSFILQSKGGGEYGTAGPGDVLNTSTIAVKGQGIVQGTIPVNPSFQQVSGVAVTGKAPGYVNTQYRPSGFYADNSSVTVELYSAGLLSENIKKGVTIFGTEGAMEPSGKMSNTITTTQKDYYMAPNQQANYVLGTMPDGVNLYCMSHTSSTTSPFLRAGITSGDMGITLRVYFDGIPVQVGVGANTSGSTSMSVYRLIINKIERTVTVFNYATTANVYSFPTQVGADPKITVNMYVTSSSTSTNGYYYAQDLRRVGG